MPRALSSRHTFHFLLAFRFQSLLGSPLADTTDRAIPHGPEQETKHMIAMILTTAFLGMPLWLAFTGESKASIEAQRRVKDQKRVDAALIAAAHALLAKGSLK